MYSSNKIIERAIEYGRSIWGKRKEPEDGFETTKRPTKEIKLEKIKDVCRKLFASKEEEISLMHKIAAKIEVEKLKDRVNEQTREIALLKKEVYVKNEEIKESNDILNNVSKTLETEQFKFKTFESKLQDKVQCPICFYIPTTFPVPICPNGHVTCRSCKRNTCPTCRAPMGQATSTIAVTIIENIDHNCKFEDDGCQVRVSLAQLTSHQTACPFRRVLCPKCDDRFPVNGLMKLIEDDHEIKIIPAPLLSRHLVAVRGRYVRGKLYNSSEVISAHGENFFFHVRADRTEKTWHFYVKMVGNEEECKNYETVINVRGQRAKGGVSYNFLGDVVPVDLSRTKQVEGRGACLVVSDDDIEKILVMTGDEERFTITVIIQKRKC